MRSRLLPLVLLLSTVGFTPAALGGQSVEAPRSFQAAADGRDVVVRWVGASGADLYVGEMDDDPRFDSPRRWAVEDHGGRVYEERLRGLSPGTYYLRVRAVERIVVIRRESPWSHVERVVVGGRDDGRRHDEPWDGVDRWPGDAVTGAPRDLEARLSGDVLRIRWRALRGADRYIVQLDDDRRFRDPYAFAVDGSSGRGVEQLTVRSVPSGRWYVRVRAVEPFVDRAGAWSAVEVVDVRRTGGRIDRRDVDLGDGRRDVSLNVHRRAHPVFEEHPGRGRGKGHVKHDRGRDRDDRDDD